MKRLSQKTNWLGHSTGEENTLCRVFGLRFKHWCKCTLNDGSNIHYRHMLTLMTFTWKVHSKPVTTTEQLCRGIVTFDGTLTERLLATSHLLLKSLKVLAVVSSETSHNGTKRTEPEVKSTTSTHLVNFLCVLQFLFPALGHLRYQLLGFCQALLKVVCLHALRKNETRRYQSKQGKVATFPSVTTQKK